MELGAVRIHRIVEFEASFAPALDTLVGLTPELLDECRPLMAPGEIDAQDNFILSYQSFLVITPDANILIDTCVGDHKTHRRPAYHMRKGSRYLERLAEFGLTPQDIHYVLCTHLHVDHVGWNTRLENGVWVPTFPNAKYLFGRREFDYWIDNHRKEPVSVIAESVLPIVEAGQAVLVEDDFELRDYVRLLPTPGHTPGHNAICLGKARDEAVVTGDLLHVSIQARHPELSFYVDWDKALAATTRRQFLERYCDTDTLCCFTHSPVTPFARILAWRKAFRFEGIG